MEKLEIKTPVPYWWKRKDGLDINDIQAKELINAAESHIASVTANFTNNRNSGVLAETMWMNENETEFMGNENEPYAKIIEFYGWWGIPFGDTLL